MEGVDLEQTERCRRIIHTLFDSGFFNLRNGSMTVHFDPKGDLGQIILNKVTYMRDKAPPLQDLLEHAIIEVNNPNSPALNQTKIGQPK